jgi:hypothetical protein
MALWAVAFMGTTPIGGPLIGWITSETNARVGLGVGAASCFIAAAIGWFTVRRYRAREALANTFIVETTVNDTIVVE